VNLDKRRVGESGGEVLRMIEAHRAIVPGRQDQRRLFDVSTDISRSPKVDQETATGLAAQ
jgi:hypothetical protein